MFCKWCGANIQITDRKCPSCGRETPPMSDCGGLYNLKQSNYTPPTPPTPVPPKPVLVPLCPIIEKMEPKYTRDRKASKSHHTTTVICFGVMVTAVILCVALLFNLYAKLNEVTEMVTCISDKLIVSTTKDDLEELPEDAGIDNSSENMSNIIALGVTIKNVENTEIGTTSDFGTYTRTAKVITANSKVDKTEDSIGVSWVISEKEEYINLDVISKADDSTATIGVKCETNVVLFEDTEFAYSWQYLNKDLRWIDISEDLLIAEGGYNSITCAEAFWNTIGSEAGLAELRCIITAENENGDAITITVDGFTVSRDLPLG